MRVRAFAVSSRHHGGMTSSDPDEIPPALVAEADQLSAMQREEGPAVQAIIEAAMAEDTSGLEGLDFEGLRAWVRGSMALDEIEGPGDLR